MATVRETRVERLLSDSLVRSCLLPRSLVPQEAKKLKKARKAAGAGTTLAAKKKEWKKEGLTGSAKRSERRADTMH